MGHHGVLVSRIIALFLALLWLHDGLVLGQASELERDLEVIRVDIAIKARQFHPSAVSVPVRRPVMLLFHNQDVDLDAFVPKRFLEGGPVHVDGNGATQFGEQGLERVLTADHSWQNALEWFLIRARDTGPWYRVYSDRKANDRTTCTVLTQAVAIGVEEDLRWNWNPESGGCG